MNQAQPLYELHHILADRTGSYRRCGGGVTYTFATAEDEAELRAMLRENEMDSWVQMTLEREPDYFAAANLVGQDFTILVRQQEIPKQIVAMAAWGVRPVHFNGRLRYLGYMGQLRVRRAFRHQFRIVREGHQAVGEVTAGLDIPCNFTSIASGNRVALRLLNANLKGMPAYQPRGHYLTFAIATARGGSKPSGWLIPHPATEGDVPELVSFHNRLASQWQFSPCLSKQWLLTLGPESGLALNDFLLWRRYGRITACVAIWDQRGVKQSVARGYRFPVNWLRRPYNLLARMARRVTLPAPAQHLQQVYLAFAAFENLSEREILSVLEQGLKHAAGKGATTAVIGLSAENPLAPAIQRQFKPITYHSEIETVHWSGQLQCGLDGRSPQPEVSLL